MSNKMNMREWKESVINSPYKKGVPVLSFPSVQLTGATVRDLVTDGETQARGMETVAKRMPALAAVSMMDLSVEAEAFGSKVRVPDNDVPAVMGEIVKTREDAENLRIPEVGEGRTTVFIDAIKRATEYITDRPVFAGIAGPFSLAGRLVGLAEIMIAAMKDPEMVKITMEKCTKFIIEYAKAYKEQTGANGFVMAEPLMGLLSPKMAKEFVTPYCKEIIDAVQDEEFIVIFHNCGNNVVKMAECITDVGAEGYHFGNSIKMEDIMPKMPKDALVMGNVDPSEQFCFGTVESMKETTKDVMEKNYLNPNFVISSGCDIGPNADWDCIDAFFEAIDEFYASKGIHLQ